jgi:octaheme c-type cytochrome (tetrathionate reductase family)
MVSIKKRGFLLIVICAFLLGSSLLWGTEKENPHKEIEGPFNTPQEVTKTCLECHEDVGDDVLKTRHWLWLGKAFVEEGKKVQMGKINMLNNFCVSVTSNWPRCTSCHIGYGWNDKTFDFTKKENIDCLVCHDLTGTYKKFPKGAGFPVKEPKKFMGKTFNPPDYLKISRNVGLPTRKNCGACHFYGGGGDGVKHGDMDSSLTDPPKELDVHMGGKNFSCTKCHISDKHNISGALHGSQAAGENHFGCVQCHKEKVHKKMAKIYDKHSKRIACQTCHIPEFARGLPTKTWWDWSTAGQDKKGAKDQYGKSLYNKKKGDFKWEKNVVPTYLWFNGIAKYHKLGQKIKDPKEVLIFNKILGDMKDSNAKIMPFKVMAGKQMYDSKNNTLIIPHLFGKGGYWKHWDWNKAFESGMKQSGQSYSGSFDWIETKMYWPINHQVAPKENSLKCKDCHGTTGRFDWKALGYKGDPKKLKAAK